MANEPNGLPAADPGKPGFEWKKPRIWRKLLCVGMLVVLGAAVLVYWALHLDDATFSLLGLKTRAALIESSAKFVAVFGAAFWAAALVILLHQRELAQESLRKSDAEIRKLELDMKRLGARLDTRCDWHLLQGSRLRRPLRG
jgi:hypothetical protein